MKYTMPRSSYPRPQTEVYVCAECGEKMTRIKGKGQTVCYGCALNAKMDAMPTRMSDMTEDEQMEQDDRREDARIESEQNHDLYEGRDVPEL